MVCEFSRYNGVNGRNAALKSIRGTTPKQPGKAKYNEMSAKQRCQHSVAGAPRKQ